jgi:hypothetical protein
MPPCPISFSAFVVAPVAFAVSGFSGRLGSHFRHRHRFD